MNILIKDFTQVDFADYLNYAIDQYAASNIKSDCWNREKAKTKI